MKLEVKILKYRPNLSFKIAPDWENESQETKNLEIIGNSIQKVNKKETRIIRNKIMKNSKDGIVTKYINYSQKDKVNIDSVLNSIYCSQE